MLRTILGIGHTLYLFRISDECSRIVSADPPLWLVARWTCVACMYASIAATEKTLLRDRSYLLKSGCDLAMNFIPSRSYFQDQQLCTFRFFVRIPFTSLGRQNYLAPNAHNRKARKHSMHGRYARSAKYSVANRVISRKLYMRSPYHFYTTLSGLLIRTIM